MAPSRRTQIPSMSGGETDTWIYKHEVAISAPDSNTEFPPFIHEIKGGNKFDIRGSKAVFSSLAIYMETVVAFADCFASTSAVCGVALTMPYRAVLIYYSGHHDATCRMIRMRSHIPGHIRSRAIRYGPW